MNPIDYLIVVTYFLAILSLGLFAGKNVNSVKAFAIADKSYPTWLIVATLLATGIGAGSLLGTAEKVFTDGIVYLFILLGYPISKFFIAKYICPRIQDFKGKISAGEIMGKFLWYLWTSYYWNFWNIIINWLH
jgi:SSS family solute:Na+ symporter